VDNSLLLLLLQLLLHPRGAPDKEDEASRGIDRIITREANKNATDFKVCVEDLWLAGFRSQRATKKKQSRFSIVGFS